MWSELALLKEVTELIVGDPSILIHVNPSHEIICIKGRSVNSISIHELSEVFSEDAIHFVDVHKFEGLISREVIPI